MLIMYGMAQLLSEDPGTQVEKRHCQHRGKQLALAGAAPLIVAFAAA